MIIAHNLSAENRALLERLQGRQRSVNNRRGRSPRLIRKFSKKYENSKSAALAAHKHLWVKAAVKTIKRTSQDTLIVQAYAHPRARDNPKGFWLALAPKYSKKICAEVFISPTPDFKSDIHQPIPTGMDKTLYLTINALHAFSKRQKPIRSFTDVYYSRPQEIKPT